MQLTERHKTYWSKNLRMTSVLLVLWFATTFIVSWYARELNEITVIGPLGFYMAAQGSLIIYVGIIWYYARYMNRIDIKYGVDTGDYD
ncbi:MAG: DUF4212 domain-containing protein [Sulfuritalea sp.]|nr:DUF4212 domain-containing protein [Sulfuritalea sp.]